MHLKYVLLVTNVGVGVQVGLEFSQLGLFDMSDDIYDDCSYVQVFDEMMYVMDAGMFRYASSVDAALEEEEQYADQLKEYYAFGDSLR